MVMGVKVSFFTNSYNRQTRLENLLLSFEATNELDEVEWIITDFGSTDGAREYLQEFARQARFPVKLILEDEHDYFQKIRRHGLKIDARWARFRAVLSWYRNAARSSAEGELLFDVGEDHQFIRCDNWLDEVQDIYSHRQQVAGGDDIAGLVPYAYLASRLSKPNNARLPEAGGDKSAYFVAKQKNYVDYSIMKRKTAEALGLFLAPLDIRPGSWEWQAWQNENDEVQPEADYARRCHRAGLIRVFMKYPITVSVPNDSEVKASDGDGLLAKLWTREELENRFGRLRRPVSSDELLNAAVRVI